MRSNEAKVSPIQKQAMETNPGMVSNHNKDQARIATAQLDRPDKINMQPREGTDKECLTGPRR